MSLTPYCASCGRQLTDEEREYYGSSCESCEGEAWALVDLADDGKLPVGDGFDWRPARDIA